MTEQLAYNQSHTFGGVIVDQNSNKPFQTGLTQANSETRFFLDIVFFNLD